MARKPVDTIRNNLDGDVTKSYRMNTQFMFECVGCSAANLAVFREFGLVFLWICRFV